MINGSVPNHVALIIDGNRRWARQQEMFFFDAYKLAGHNLVENVCVAARLGVKHITAFLFSTENWKRDPDEINDVMTAFKEILYEHTPTFKRHGIRAYTIGHTPGLPSDVQEAIRHSICETASCSRTNFILAFNYGGRWDILDAVKRAARELHNGDLDALSEETFSRYLSTAPFGDPDLLIRTGTQRRVSNFLMWQLAYTELYFSDLMWPDFTPAQFELAIEEVAARERRMGGG